MTPPPSLTLEMVFGMAAQHPPTIGVWWSSPKHWGDWSAPWAIVSQIVCLFSIISLTKFIKVSGHLLGLFSCKHLYLHSSLGHVEWLLRPQALHIFQFVANKCSPNGYSVFSLCSPGSGKYDRN